MFRFTTPLATLLVLLSHTHTSICLTELTPEALEGDIQTGALESHSRQFQSIADLPQSQGTRAYGTYGYNKSIEYVYNALAATNAYDLELQSFLWPYHKIVTSGLDIDGPVASFNPAKNTPGTSSEGITAPLILIPDLDSAGCTADDFTGLNVTGNILLMKRGTCTLAVKSKNAATAGAAALIMWNNVNGSLAAGLGKPAPGFVPTGTISLSEGEALASRLQSGESIIATFTAVVEIIDRYSANLIATSKAGNQSNIVFTGAHLDSVAEGPGINDDGSGSSSNLEIALQLTKYELNNAVRFAWWSAEEEGLIGSQFYVDSLSDNEISKISLYLNYDMIASPNYILGVYNGDGTAGINNPPGAGPAGSAEIEAVYKAYFTSRNLSTVPTPFSSGRSDYGPFIAIGIPAGGLGTGADAIKTTEQAALFGGTAGVACDPNYHQSGDTFDNLNFTAFTIMSKAAANVLAQFIQSTDAIKSSSSATRKRDCSVYDRSLEKL